jgi:bacterioferritin-associated ferredoxin
MDARVKPAHDEWMEKNMTPEQIKLVQQSFAKVGPISEQAALSLYNRLFDICCDAIARGARSAVEIGAKLKAGTNCGSCIPEMKRLIAQAAQNSVPQQLLAAAN